MIKKQIIARHTAREKQKECPIKAQGFHHCSFVLSYHSPSLIALLGISAHSTSIILHFAKKVNSFTHNIRRKTNKRPTSSNFKKPPNTYRCLAVLKFLVAQLFDGCDNLRVLCGVQLTGLILCLRFLVEHYRYIRCNSFVCQALAFGRKVFADG